MHFSHRGENEVLKVAECQRGHNSCRGLGEVATFRGVGTSLAGYSIDCHVSISCSFLVSFVALCLWLPQSCLRIVPC